MRRKMASQWINVESIRTCQRWFFSRIFEKLIKDQNIFHRFSSRRKWKINEERNRFEHCKIQPSDESMAFYILWACMFLFKTIFMHQCLLHVWITRVWRCNFSHFHCVCIFSSSYFDVFQLCSRTQMKERIFQWHRSILYGNRLESNRVIVLICQDLIQSIFDRRMKFFFHRNEL